MSDVKNFPENYKGSGTLCEKFFYYSCHFSGRSKFSLNTPFYFQRFIQQASHFIFMLPAWNMNCISTEVFLSCFTLQMSVLMAFQFVLVDKVSPNW